MENVTTRVQSAAPSGASAAQALEARKKVIAAIEQESTTKTGLRSDVVPLYQWQRVPGCTATRNTPTSGWCSRPSSRSRSSAAIPDNFTYPRYDFDIALFRVYENNAPVASRDYLKWSAKGAADGELVFVSGHPGSTDRLDTVAQLETERDVVYPISIEVVSRRIDVLRKYSEQGAEQARQAADARFSLENALQGVQGRVPGAAGHRADGRRSARSEREFRARIDANREWKSLYDATRGTRLPSAEQMNRSLYKASRFQQLRGSSLAGLAASLVRYIEEKQKPDAERLNGYHDAQLPALELQLFSPAPVYPRSTKRCSPTRCRSRSSSSARPIRSSRRC